MFDYLNKQNRPYSAIDICNNLHKEHGKTVSSIQFVGNWACKTNSWKQLISYDTVDYSVYISEFVFF